MSKKDAKEYGSKSKRMGRSQRKLLEDEAALHRRALSMALHQHQLSQRFENGSMSRRVNSGTGARTRRTLSEPIDNPKQVIFELALIFFFMNLC